MSLQDDLESQKQTCSELEEDKGRLISKLESEQQAHEREKRERAQVSHACYMQKHRHRDNEDICGWLNRYQGLH